MLPPLSTLKKVALYGACFCVGSGLYFSYRIQSNFCETGYYKQAMITLKQNRGAVDLLGEPIRDGWLDLGNWEDNQADAKSARLRVPVRGPKTKAELYLWASRKEFGKAWMLDRLELALPTEANRRLLVYDKRKKEETVEYPNTAATGSS